MEEKKGKKQVYPLQMTDIPDRAFDKIAIDLVSDLNVSASENQCILTIIDQMIIDKKADTIVHVFINTCLPIHMCPCFQTVR